MQNNSRWFFCDNLYLVYRFNIYFLKKCFNIRLNLLDCCIGDILDEYSYLYDYRKEYKKKVGYIK